MSDGQLDAAMEDVGVVIHAAATPKLGALSAGSLRALHVEATARLASSAARAGARRFVHLSTAFLPPSADGELRAELCVPDVRDRATATNEYEASKASGELVLVEAAARAAGGRLEVVILRPGIVLPPREGPLDGIAASPLGSFALAMAAAGAVETKRDAATRADARTVVLPGGENVAPGFVHAEDVVVRILAAAIATGGGHTTESSEGCRLRIEHIIAETRPTLRSIADELERRLPDLRVDFNPEAGARAFAPWRPYLSRHRRWTAGAVDPTQIPAATLAITPADIAHPIVRRMRALGAEREGRAARTRRLPAATLSRR
jgi:nucleoside-diphosphate-sugar epimerase